MIHRDHIKLGLFGIGLGIVSIPYHLGLDSLLVPMATVGFAIAVGGPFMLNTRVRTKCAGCEGETLNTPYCPDCGAAKGIDETLNYERLLARLVVGRDA